VASPFHALLAATIEHLKVLKASGVRMVNVAPETLVRLGRLTSAPGSGRGSSTRPPSARGNTQTGAATRPPAERAPAAGLGRTQPINDRIVSSNLAGSAQPALEPSLGKETALEEIRLRALVCQKCPHLVRSRTQVVFGVGNPGAELMFVGEAPGYDEDRQGEPFVGRAGQLLTRMIQAMGYTRNDVYIANVLKCRPDMPPGARGNRPPRGDEMNTCKPYLMGQIEIIQPKAIVALGLTAVQGLLGVGSTMGSVRGRWHEFRGIPVMPTFHPSYLLRAEAAPDRGHTEKRKTWEDMLQVLDRLGRPISEKMRGYFRPPPGPPGMATPD
jgi:DNA polymerase